ncbi:MAG: O-antigen ligase family protein, partial [Kofleriaceae bacterium]|nr:O-antigen ligase family protein [Kofleriaceae bacterium]
MTFIAGCGVLVTTTSRRGFTRRSPLQVLLAIMAVVTALQLVPLPSALAELLSPTGFAFSADGADIAGFDQVARISVDPASTLRSLACLIALNAVAMVALRLSVSERGRYLLLASVAAVCGITAAIAGLHALVGARSLYGIYEPHQAGPGVMGPLLNPNHMGCLMAVGAVIAAGLLVYPRQRVALRVIWGCVIVACVALLAAAQSRGAILALAVGTLALLTTLFVQRTQGSTVKRGSRSRREKFLVTTVPLTIIIVCATTSALYVGADGVVAQLENTSLKELDVPTSKFAAWRSSFVLVEESPWMGVGRGAFEPAFTRVHPASAFATFSHPENTLVQAVVEWGLPATLVLCGVGIWLVLFGVRQWRDGPLAASAIGAIAAVAFQSNFDFGIEMLGIAVPITVVAATICRPSFKELRPARLRAARGFRVAIALVAVIGMICLLLPMTTTIDEDHRAIAEEPTTERILESLERHPLDYFGYAVLAEQMIKAKRPESVRVLNHALRLHPTHPGLHRLAARLLMRSRSTNQAELEYAVALAYSVDMRGLLAEMASTMPPDRVAHAIA